MTPDLTKLSTSALEAELCRRRDNEKMLGEVADALRALDHAQVIVRLECGVLSNLSVGYGPTSPNMRKLLVDAMRSALLARKAELEVLT